jgi:hypothetical protein
MLAGSLLACSLLRRPPLRLPVPLAWAALGCLIALFANPVDAMHPRGDALVVVALTSLLLASDGSWVGRSTPVCVTARIGDWSYSLYLVHWPLFALAAGAYLGVVPPLVRGLLVLLALFLAWAQFRFVEQRFRHRRSSLRMAALAFGSGALAVAMAPVAAGMLRTDAGQRVSAQLAESTRGLSARCAAGQGVSEPTACSTGAPATVALWGDSYAMQLVPGLLELPQVSRNLIQITMAACAPIIDIASIDDKHDENWARGCLAFSRSALQRIVTTHTITHVILSSPYAGYLDEGPLTLYTPAGTVTASRTAALERFVDTVRQLQDAGKNVIVVAPPPRPGFDAGACLEQAASGLLLLGRRDCDFLRSDHLSRQRGIYLGLEEVARETGTPLHRFDTLLCDDLRCRSSDSAGQPLYKDDGHLTAHASRLLMPKLGLNLPPSPEDRAP